MGTCGWQMLFRIHHEISEGPAVLQDDRMVQLLGDIHRLSKIDSDAVSFRLKDVGSSLARVAQHLYHC